jgi:serine/threonine protein kinase/Tol biopolymer transport system component
MTLPQGTRFGPYEVIALIGEGGMGEVYRARDSRLGRHVAIKILSREFTSDPDRVQRFEREARVLASVNHPHIATIHGVEDAEGMSALVMELVDGETLADRIVRGALPVPTALALAGQIADALDAAHERGIIHRDLKPSNVKVTSAGTIKVLDFGLAKSDTASRPGRADGTPDVAGVTGLVTIDETAPGVLLGTAAYMSPEQARGQVVDKRTDIWAFGCVLFEMLTGRSPFVRATVPDMMAAVLEHEPDWAAIPGSTPEPVMRALRSCLEKDPRHRLRDFGDWTLTTDPGAQKTPAPIRRSWIPWAAALVCCIGTAAWLLLSNDRKEPTPAPLIRFDVPAAVELSESGQFSVSPDGRHLVFAGTGDDRILRLWVKSFDAPEIRPLPGTEAEVVPVIPPMFWSADSQFIAFYADGKIKRVARAGGSPDVLCAVPAVAVGGSWSRDGIIVVGNANGPLLRCSADGKTAAAPVTANRPEVRHLMPSFLPDGRHFVYLHVSRSDPSGNGLYLGDLQRPPDQQPGDRLLATGFGGAYVPAADGKGHLLFVRDGALFAVAFDPDRQLITGEPVTLATPVGAFLDTAFFTASMNAVVYRSARSDFQLTWLDRRGTVLGRVAEPGPFSGLALSPDGLRAVAVRENQLNRADQDLWMVDLVRNTTNRFTTDPSIEAAPAWSPDGKEIWYTVGTGQGEILRKATSGATAAAMVFSSTSSPDINPSTTTLSMSASPAGDILWFTVGAFTRTRNDLWMLRQGAGQKPVPVLQQDLDQSDGHLSPDGRWLAYVSNESGSPEVLVRTITLGDGAPVLGDSLVVSSGGGKSPRWRADSRELLYQTFAGTIMSASVVSEIIGAPVEVTRVPGALSDWGLSADGQRFLVGLPTKQAASPPFTVLVNWQSSLSRSVAGSK